MTNLNVNQNTGGNIFFDASGAAQATSKTSQEPIMDGQTKAADTSMLTLGGNKIPPIPVLFSDPRTHMDNRQKTQDDTKDSGTIVARAADGSIVTKGSGTTIAGGTSPPSLYAGLTKAGVEYENSEVIGKNPDIMEFMKIIQDAIANLQKQLYAAQQGQSSIADNAVPGTAFINAFVTASKADPKMADLIILRAELENVRVDHIGSAGSKTNIDMSTKESIVQLLQKYGISKPPAGWGDVSIADITQLINDVDAQVTAQAQSLGVAGKTLESLLAASLFAFLPSIEKGSPIFDMLHLTNALLQAGFTGTDPVKDQQVLNNNPDLLKSLQTWRALPSTYNNVFTAEQLAKVLSHMERIAILIGETTTITTNDVLYMRAPGSFDFEVKAAKNFLDSMGPINDEINNMMGGDVNSIVNDTDMSDAAKTRIKGVVSGLLAQSLLKSTVNPEGGNTPINLIEQAITGLMGSGAASRLSRIFVAKAPTSVADASTAERVPRYKGKKHKGNLSKMEDYIVKNLNNYDLNVAFSTGMASNFNKKFFTEEFPKVIADLSKVNLDHIPEVYDWLRDHPDIVKRYPETKKILDNEPWDVKNPQTVLGRNKDDIDAHDIQRERQFDGEVHKWPLSKDEQTVVNLIEEYRKRNPKFLLSKLPFDPKFPERFEKGMELLKNIDPARIPEIYDFLREHDDIVKEHPFTRTILAQQPWIVTKIQTEDEMIQTAIKMLQKILANLTSGGTNVDLAKVTSTLSDSLGLVQIGNQNLLSNQMM